MNPSTGREFDFRNPQDDPHLYPGGGFLPVPPGHWHRLSPKNDDQPTVPVVPVIPVVPVSPKDKKKRKMEDVCEEEPNQQQLIAELKAEVERLKAENSNLKGWKKAVGNRLPTTLFPSN